MNKIEYKDKRTTPSEVKVGQIYEYNDSFYIVAKLPDFQYCLINLQSGVRWNNPTDIDKIWGDDLFAHFTLVTDSIIITPDKV